MVWNAKDRGSRSADSDAIIVSLFVHASDARRALQALSEQHFTSDEVTAAFREQASPQFAAGTAPASGKWFGQLRQIYRGEQRRNDAEPIETPTGVAPAWSPNKFDSMLSRLQISPEDALVLDRDLSRGAAIVTVQAGARNHEARSLLERRGAQIVHDSELVPGSDHRPPVVTPASSPAVVNSSPFVSPQEADPGHIQLFGEVLRVHKEKVSSGEVHVRKEAVTHMETVQVPVTREDLVVEHSDSTGSVDAENTLRIPLSEERVHVKKDTVLREEYKVGKREVTQNQSVSDTVRRERLLIDEAGTEKIS